MIALLVFAVLFFGMSAQLGIGLLPMIALVGITGLAFRGIIACVNLMIESFASFFKVDRQTAIMAQVLIVASLIFPYLIGLWLLIAVLFFRKVDHA